MTSSIKNLDCCFIVAENSIKSYQKLSKEYSAIETPTWALLLAESMRSVKFNVSIDNRIKGATSVVGHKPSTTQDLNAGKPLEIDPIIGSIIEIANKLQVETPNLKTINSRLKIKAENMGLYKRSKLIDKLTS